MALRSRQRRQADLFWESLAGTPSFGEEAEAALPVSIPAEADEQPCGERAETLDRFAYDGSQLNAAHQAAVDRAARAIDQSQSSPTPVTVVCIVGHTDSSGGAAYNRQLGARRAANVETALRGRLDSRSPGLSARLTFRTTSAGASVPIASNATADGMARNRRVEVLFTRGQAPEAATATGGPAPRGREDAAEMAEGDPPGPFVVPVGTAGFGLQGTGTPVPGTFFWTTTDPAVGRVSPTSEPDVQPNLALVIGRAPGRATVRMRYRPSRGGEAFWRPDIIVVRSSLSGLLEPPGRPATGPLELVRPIQRSGGVARRSVVVQLEPADFWAGKEVAWAFAAGVQRGALPASVANLEQSPGFDFTASTGRSVVAADGRAAVRVNMPPVSQNRGTLVATPDGRSNLAVTVSLEVPGIVVIDAGHGGTTSFGDSSSNNASGVTTGTLEKNLALDMALRTRNALLARDRLVRVHLTRDDDFNVHGSDRAQLARFTGADIFLSIHFNGGPAATRGTSTWVRANANGNVNRAEDVALAQRVQAAVFGAIPGGSDRGVQDDTASSHPTGLAVLNDNNYGNTAALHPIRGCLVEVEYLSNAAADAQLNTAADRETLRRNIAEAIAGALIDDLSNQP